MTGPGAALAERFYRHAVRPVLDSACPGLPHLAGRLGHGSDVLGFDDEMSHDHDFGCRLTLLLDEESAVGGGVELVQAIRYRLDAGLPDTFEGWPVRFALTAEAGADHHQVVVATVRDFCGAHLGVDPMSPLATEDWLCLTGQSVLEVTAGPVFHDSTVSYGPVRDRLEWYPDDLWLYVLSSGWARLSQEMPFVGRAGSRGDDIGAALLSARLARDLIHLAFLIERRWPPYPKWVGTALRSLEIGPSVIKDLVPALAGVRGDRTGLDDAGPVEPWRRQEQSLCTAATLLADRQRSLGLPTPDHVVQPFFGRPFRTVDEAVSDVLRDAIPDPEVHRLPRGIGSVEQWCDNVDVLSDPVRRALTRNLYRKLLSG